MKKKDYLENTLLTLLFSASSKTLQAFTLNQRLGISQTDFLKIIFEMQNNNLLIVDGVFVKLSELGVRRVLLNFNTVENNIYDIPKRFLSDKKLNINELYIPKRSLL